MSTAAEAADRAVRSLRQVDRGVDHIAEHRAGSWQATGAASVEHQRTDRGALDEHGVVAAVDAGQRVADGNHRRVHTHCDVARLEVDLGDAQQLDDVAKAFGHGDVCRGDSADALVVHVAGDHLRPEGDRRHDRRLGPGIEPFDIGCWVTFGETQCLRLGESDAVVGALLGHLGEDEVGGAVDDPHDSSDRLAAQALAQYTDDGDATGNRRFEQQIDTGVVADAEQFGAHVGEQLLVGRDDGLA